MQEAKSGAASFAHGGTELHTFAHDDEVNGDRYDERYRDIKRSIWNGVVPSICGSCGRIA